MRFPNPEDVPARRMTGASLLIHLRWAAALDRAAWRPGRDRRIASSVVLLPDPVVRQAIARLALR